LLLLLSLLS